MDIIEYFTNLSGKDFFTYFEGAKIRSNRGGISAPAIIYQSSKNDLPPLVFKFALDIEGRAKQNSYIDCESKILEVAQDFLDKGITDNIVRYYGRFYRSLEDINVPVEKEHELIINEDNEGTFIRHIAMFQKYLRKGFQAKRIQFIIMEAVNDVSLYNFVSNKIKFSDFGTGFKHMESILFQIFYTLYVMDKIHPKFTHGDLHTDNITLAVDGIFYKQDEHHFLHFIIEGVEYFVPYYGITPKIIDFEFGEIPSKNMYSKRQKDIRNNKRIPDIIMLAQCLYLSDKIFVDMLSKFIPSNIYKYPQLSIIEDEELDKYRNPVEFLQNSYFDKFKNYTTEINRIDFPPVEDFLF